MKKALYLMLISATLDYAHAQTELPTHAWTATLKAVDETGQPIPNANASVGYFSKSQPASINGLTDTNGLFTASHTAYSGLLGFVAGKPGYYTTRAPSYDLGYTYDAARW